jgi:hypothetical protein
MSVLKFHKPASIIRVTVLYLFLFQISESFAQTSWPSEDWTSAVNLTDVMNTNGLTELSGLHWNPLLHRLYVIDDAGHVRILLLDTETNTFSQIANKNISGGPEGITQVDYSKNEFYTIDENNYEIRKYTHSADFSNLTLANYWNILASPSPMQNTGNTGPEGIAFVPDSFLTAIQFRNQETGLLYTSVKGMGGLIFIAHQDQGYVWVFDLNPNTNNDFAYVGKYKTNRSESCDLEFDRSTGMLYILHNTGSNYLEVTDLSSSAISGGRKFNLKKEYILPNPAGNTNIEGFAITPKCIDSVNVSAWLCRDVASTDDIIYQKDCLRWFHPFTSTGTCAVFTNPEPVIRSRNKIIIYPNPADELASFNESLIGIQVYNIFGELVINTTGSANYLITSSLSNGIYLLKCNRGIERFIVKH